MLNRCRKTILFTGLFISAAVGQVSADSDEFVDVEAGAARPYGLYTNRHHHALNQADGSLCGPDFNRARIFAERASGKTLKGVYHTRSKDINPGYSNGYRGPLPLKIYVKKLRRTRTGPVRRGYEILPQEYLPQPEIRNIVRRTDHRDCLSPQK